MTAIDSYPAEAADSVLARLDSAMYPHELENAWVEALRETNVHLDRDRILAAAGKRLCVFDEVADDWLRRRWLDQVASEVQRRGEQPVGDELAATAMSEVREAFARSVADFASLRSYVSAGEDIAAAADRMPQPAMRIRDLGRVTKRLQGCGLLALVAEEDAELATDVAEAQMPSARLVPVVPERWRVTRDDLLGWSALLDARGYLPRLIHRLVAETTTADRIDFPAGTGVGNPGWDGMVECARGTQYVPAGLSGWELSVAQSNSDRKARDDYDTRVKDYASEDPSGTAYVALICAPWTKARRFQDEKSSAGHFRSVRALNVDRLEAWLECAPTTTVWLRELMGERVTGVKPLSTWWQQWLTSTTIPIESNVVLAGREDQAERLRDRLRQRRGGVVTVGGVVHRDEILAFVAAALCASDGSAPACADVLCVDDQEAAQRLLASATPAGSASPNPQQAVTVVVPSDDFAAHLPAGANHQMIVPIPGSAQADIVLEAVDSDIAAQHLRASVEDLHPAHELGSLARMSLIALRRHLAVQPEAHRPGWAAGPITTTLRRSLLLGGWDGSREGDRQVVEKCAGHDYEAVTEALRQLDLGDAPMIATGELWHLVAPADSWTLLAHHLTSADIEAFCEAAHKVLTEPDPLHGLSGDELISAQLGGTRAKYSPSLKRGIATTLALLGAHPPTLYGTTTPNTSIATRVVWTVLNSANEDASTKTWAAVAEVLPLLSEAAPEVVLEALRTCLSEQHEFAKAMFTDSEVGGFGFSPTPHIQVLNALEVMAWSRDHLMAVADLLARLAKIDPGGHYANRPDDSLATIFCAWLPHTAASSDERLASIRMLRRSHNEVAWPLMLSMLPDGRHSQMRKDGPRFRDWNRPERVVTQAEYGETATSIAEMLLKDVGSDPSRWMDLIGEVAILPEDIRARTIAALDRVAADDPDDTFRSRVFTGLLTLVRQHRQHHNAHWALPESELADLDEILERLRPSGRSASYGDLFSPSLSYIDGVGAIDGLEAFEAALEPRQTEAVEAILADGGPEAVLEFAMEVEQPGLVGIALARAKPELDKTVLDAMLDAPAPITSVGLGYFEHRFAALGWEGIDGLIASHEVHAQVAADLHRAIPAVEAPWNRVDAHGSEVADAYWRRANYFDIRVTSELSELLTVSYRLRQAGRTELARTLLSRAEDDYESDPEFAEEVAACLEQWIQSEVAVAEAPGTMVAWELASLIKVLNRHRKHLGIGRSATIEWLCFPLLRNRPGSHPSSLYIALAQDPGFFAQLVELAYKPAGASADDASEPTEASLQIALNAHEVLHSWPSSQFAPGVDGEGRMDEASLNSWVDDARERLAELDRTDIGDRMIGTALAASPADPDGAWPGQAVCGLIERLERDDIDNGMSEAIFAQRGGTTRSPTGGGDQERALAEQYRQKSQSFAGWPRTAALFRGLARSYEHLAEVVDRRAEVHRRGLPL